MATRVVLLRTRLSTEEVRRRLATGLPERTWDEEIAGVGVVRAALMPDGFAMTLAPGESGHAVEVIGVIRDNGVERVLRLSFLRDSSAGLYVASCAMVLVVGAVLVGYVTVAQGAAGFTFSLLGGVASRFVGTAMPVDGTIAHFERLLVAEQV
jgi:hypothetical protein